MLRLESLSSARQAPSPQGARAVVRTQEGGLILLWPLVPDFAQQRWMHWPPDGFSGSTGMGKRKLGYETRFLFQLWYFRLCGHGKATTSLWGSV